MGFLDLFKKKESADDPRNKSIALYEESKYRQAAECFTKAMEMDDIGAEMMLGTMLLGGKGITQDIAAGISHIKNSADNEYPPALVSMADFYANGTGGEQDGARVFQFMKDDVIYIDEDNLGYVVYGDVSNFDRGVLLEANAGSWNDEYFKQVD